MTYYYLAADQSTRGPETLEVLTGLVAGGTVSLATLVVPAGGEDWTPLARVLRYFYSDAAGATAGPVAFSELQRLNQTGVLDGGAWVLEEGAEQWKTLESVIMAGGAEVFVAAPVAAAQAAPRTATGAYRPPGGRTQGVGEPHAAPRAGGQKVVVRHRVAARGMERGPFFMLYLLMIIIDVVAVVVFIKTKFPENAPMEFAEFWLLINQYLILLAVLYFLTLGVTSLLTFSRLRNIGWPVALVALHLLFFLSVFLPANVKHSSGGTILLLALAGIDYLLLALLLIMPPGFARHRRMDGTAKLNAFLVPLITAGIVYGVYTWVKYEDRKHQEWMEKNEKEQSLPKS